MARFADYGIHTEDLSNSREIMIQGQKFPVAFTMVTMEYIADIYGGDYSIFEKDMNDMIGKSEGQLNSSTLKPADLKIMRALIYAMLRTGGLEESPETVFKVVGMNGDVLTAYAACMEIFSDQTFQVEDIKKSKKPQDFQKAQPKRNKNKKKRKR